jgi:5'(3')-deoxyribonucleotidase
MLQMPSENNKRHAIVIDFDEVMINIAVNITKAYNELYGTNAVLEDYMKFNDLSSWGVDKRSTVVDRCERYIEKTDFHDFTPLPHAPEVIGRLSKKYDLYVVTARSPRLENVTKACIDHYFKGMLKSVIYTNFFHKKAVSKGEVCQEIGADLLIDDHLPHVLETAERGIDVFLFGNSPWNQTTSLPSHVVRVKDWNDIAQRLLEGPTQPQNA